MNAGTSYDYTIYFVNVPANKLELWFWMESDRLLNPVFREFYSEREVVHEEPIYVEKHIDGSIVEAALQYNDSFNEFVYSFVNCINTHKYLKVARQCTAFALMQGQDLVHDRLG